MGYICHNAIIVTGYEPEAEKAYERVAALVRTHSETIGGVSEHVLSPLSRSVTNGYRSFAIFPDGSKEGWGTSDDGNDLRDDIVDALDNVWVEWCEVRFGDEADMNGMTRCSGEPPPLLPTRREADDEASGHYGRTHADGGS